MTLDAAVYSMKHTEGGASSLITGYTAQYDESTHGKIVPDIEEVEMVEWVPANLVPKMIAEDSRKFTQGFQAFVIAHPELF